MNEITQRPTWRNSVVAGIAAVVAVALAGAGWGSTTALVVGLPGLLAFGIGLWIGRRSALDVGTFFVFLGVVIGGLGGSSVELTVIATIATVLAWDLGHRAVDLGEQLGREAKTARLESVHIVSSLFVGLLSATLGYGVYIFAAASQPVATVALLLFAACFVVIALGSRRNKLHATR